MTRSQHLALFLALAAFAPSPAAPTAKPKDGRAVMEEVDQRRRTASEYSEGIISVTDKGKTKVKSWRSWRRGWGASAMGLIQFLEPAEVKGVGLLTLSHPGKPADQWFYAPAIDRDRRVAKQEKSTRFLGTHFTYEDMEERDIDAYTYVLDGEETLEGELCFKVTATPKPEEESQYSKLEFWVLQSRWVTIRVVTFVDGERRRTFSGSDVREVAGVPLVHRWALVDAKREGTTELTLANVHLNAPADAGLFTVSSMRSLHEPPR